MKSISMKSTIAQRLSTQSGSLLQSRWFFHAFLALVATPLPGGFLVAGRLFLARRRAEGFKLVTWAFGGFLVGAWVSLFLPVTEAKAFFLTSVVWVVTGLGVGRWEEVWRVSPARVLEGPVRPWAEIFSWVSALLVAGLSWALLIAPMTSRWGSALYLKPSAARHVLFVLIIIAIPIGCFYGLIRSLVLKRPFRVASPLLYPTACLVVVVFSILAIALSSLLLTEVFDLAELAYDASNKLFIGLVISVWIIAPLGVVTAYLSDSTGIRQGGLRLIAVGGLVTSWIIGSAILGEDLGCRYHALRAERTAQAGQYARAIEHWSWILRRTRLNPKVDLTPRAISLGARDSLLAGQLDTARWFLARVDEKVQSRFDVGTLAEQARKIRESSSSLGEVIQAELRPVQWEDYLDDKWSTLITAAGSARPEFRESELKRKLQRISPSVDSPDLPEGEDFWMAEVTAGLFDLEVLIVEPDQYRTVLAEGLPVLFARSNHGGWRLIWWVAPAADSAIFLDYSLWDEGDDQLQASQLSLTPTASPTTYPIRRAKMSRLTAFSSLEEGASFDPGWSLVLVPREESQKWQNLLSRGEEDTRQMSLLSELRQALRSEAYSYVKERLPALTDGQQKREIETVVALQKKRDRMFPSVSSAMELALEEDAGDFRLEAWNQARAAVDAWVREGNWDGATPWYLGQLYYLKYTDPSYGCIWQSRILDRRQEINPDSGHLRQNRFELAVVENRHDDAADIALSLARSQKWADVTLLNLLGHLASLPEAGRNEKTRQALRTLSQKLPFIIFEADPMLRSANSAYWAARAALAEEVNDRVSAWERAVNLDPNRWRYRARWAEALEEADQKEKAVKQRRLVLASAPAPRCESEAEIFPSESSLGARP